MSQTPRQKLLFLYLSHSDLYSRVVAWSLFDGTTRKKPSLDQATPPYPTGVDAMRDGWRVIQVSPLMAPPPGLEFDVDYLANEVILEKLEVPSHE
jgi:hypothetical protein